MSFLNISMPNVSMPNITLPNISMPDVTIPTKIEVENWLDGQTSIGQCVSNATEAVDILRCDPDLASLPTKYDPFGLCYEPIRSSVPVFHFSWDRIIHQLYSQDLLTKVTEGAIQLRTICIEQRRNCSLMFNRTDETALKAFECLKPYFGNMFHFENDSSIQNLCRIAYNKFGEARGLLEIDLFTRGLSFFDKECSLLEPLEFFRSGGLLFDSYVDETPFLMYKAIAASIGVLAVVLFSSETSSSPRSQRVVSHLSLGASSAIVIYAGKWKAHSYFIDQLILTALISFTASSAFGALYHAFRKKDVVAVTPKGRASAPKGTRRPRARSPGSTAK